MTFIKQRAFIHMGKGLGSALLIGALALTMAACGDETTPEQPGGGDGPAAVDPGDEPAFTDNPCEMLSREEVAAIVGNEVSEGEHFVTQCIWHPGAQDGTQVKAVLTYNPIDADVDPETVCHNLLAGAPFATAPFTGTALGNEAHWSYATGSVMVGGNIGTLYVCTDRAFMMAQTIGDRTEAELQQMTISMLTTVLGRL